MKIEQSIRIDASPTQLWEVLTNPDYTEQYMYNCRVNTDWELGSEITWKGNFRGYNAFQKGEVVEYEPMSHLKYTTFDPNYGLPDEPENYIHVGYHVHKSGDGSLLTVDNETFDGDKKRLAHIKQGWETVLNGIKEVAEEAESRSKS